MSDNPVIIDRRQPAPEPPVSFPWWVLPGLAGVVLVIFAGALAASCFLDDNTLRTQMFTGAYGLATMSVGYFFGSSAGSAKKDDAIASVVAKGPPAQVTTTMTTKTEPATSATDVAPAKPATTTTEVKSGPIAPEAPKVEPPVS